MWQRRKENEEMCLYKNDEATRKLIDRHKRLGNKEITVWKTYYVNGNDVKPPYKNYGDRIKAGWVKSNRQSKLIDDRDKKCSKKQYLSDVFTVKINRGIRVYLTRAEARASGWWDKIFKCTAMLKDLVAVGNSNGSMMVANKQAVFTKIWISKEEFAKGKKGRNN